MNVAAVAGSRGTCITRGNTMNSVVYYPMQHASREHGNNECRSGQPRKGVLNGLR